MTKKISLKLSSLFMVAFAALLMQSTALAQESFEWTSGNPSCATLNASTDTRVAYITSDWEFKVDPPTEGPVALTGSGLLGGMPATPNISLSMMYNIVGGERKTMSSWSLFATSGTLTRLVTAVIVKGGNGNAVVYPYPTGDTGDSGLFKLTNNNAISHLSFCFDLTTGPSAADASITGRVVDPYGRGLAGATLKLIDFNTGLETIAVTNTFGYYKFTGLEVMNFYNLDVKHRRYTFNESVKSFSLQTDLTDMNFSAAR